MSVVIRGAVSVKLHGLLKQKQLQGNWGVLYDADGTGNRPPRIELFDDKNAESSQCVLLLEQLKFSDKSYQQGNNHFMLSIKRDKHLFQFQSVGDKQDWVFSLCHVSKELWKQRATASESSDLENSDSAQDMNVNLLYESFEKVNQFKVSICPTNSSKSCGLQGHYKLSPTRDSLRLLEMDGVKTVHEWPYRQIRKYGRTRHIFKLEVGRRCSTGAGEFEFFTPDGTTIADLINKYAQGQPQQNEVAPPQPGPPEAEYVEGFSLSEVHASPNDHKASAVPVQSQMSKDTEIAKNRDSATSVPSRGSSSSVSTRRDAPIPVPRSGHRSSTKQINDVANDPANNSSGDTKIYETSSGLTAPLTSQLKLELNSKLHKHIPDPQDISSQSQDEEIEDGPVPNITEAKSSKHSSSKGNLDLKKSEKEKKKQEKERKAEEAKQKKMQEKELKEQRERELKADKEKQKQLKKESKHKMKGKKSVELLETPEPMPFSDGNIYDEPGELPLTSKTAPKPSMASTQEKADQLTGLSPEPSNSELSSQTPDVYSTPQKLSKDSWKTRGREESENVHDEDYNSIKRAALTNTQSKCPPIPPYNPSPQTDDVEDAYSHLGDIKPEMMTNTENIYGLASGTATVTSQQPVFVSGNEYEDCDVAAGPCLSETPTGKTKETGALPAAAAMQAELDEGDYASVI